MAEQGCCSPRAEGVQHIIVHGPMPVIGRGSIPKYHSSGPFVRGGASSPLWQELGNFDVDLYLAGELHTYSQRTALGVTQVVHGAATGVGAGNYLVGDVYRDRIEVTIKSFTGSMGSGQLWQLAAPYPPAQLTFLPHPTTIASFVVR